MRVLLLLLAATVAEAGESAQAVALWAKQCASCHTVPDPVVRTDLAWIRQVAYTT